MFDREHGSLRRFIDDYPSGVPIVVYSFSEAELDEGNDFDDTVKNIRVDIPDEAVNREIGIASRAIESLCHNCDYSQDLGE